MRYADEPNVRPGGALTAHESYRSASIKSLGTIATIWMAA